MLAWLEAEGDRAWVVVDDIQAVYPIHVDPVSATEDKIIASDGAEYDTFGYRLSGAGDVNGDGYDDVIIASSQDNDSGRYSGSAYVYYGSGSGIDTATEDKIIASDGAEDDVFGWSLSGAGDVNGDGYDDVIIGAYGDDDSGRNSGSAYVYYGSSVGIDTASEDKIIASDAAESDYFGVSVSGAGDVNGDGYDDVIIGANGNDDSGDGSGSAYVYYGEPVDADGDGIGEADDCDDSDSSVGGPVTRYIDADGDGYGDLSTAVMVCSDASGYVDDESDCDDTNPTTYPGAPET